MPEPRRPLPRYGPSYQVVGSFCQSRSASSRTVRQLSSGECTTGATEVAGAVAGAAAWAGTAAPPITRAPPSAVPVARTVLREGDGGEETVRGVRGVQE